MDSLQIRPIGEDEFPAALEVSSVAFAEEPTEEDARIYQVAFPFDRSLCAFENGKMVAVSAVYSLELTVPGGVAVPMGGLTWVATLPTHRRRGLLRQLMLAQFADMIDRGEIVSGLGASEGGIYGRFGYGPAAHFASFQVERAHAGFASPVEDGAGGRVTLLNAAESAAQLPLIYESLRLRQPGAVSRPQNWWSGQLGDPTINRVDAGRMYHCKHETVPGTADGYVSYRVKEQWVRETPAYEVRVVELQAANLGAYRALWEYLLNTDLSTVVSFWRGRVDEPLRWLLADPRQFRIDALADFLLLRLLDVPRALAARAYSCPGELVLEVGESFPTPSRNRYALRAASVETSDTECVATTTSPDLVIEIDALAAAYLGGVSFATLAEAGRVHESRVGAVARADAMFSSGTAPYCVTEF